MNIRFVVCHYEYRVERDADVFRVDRFAEPSGGFRCAVHKQRAADDSELFVGEFTCMDRAVLLVEPAPGVDVGLFTEFAQEFAATMRTPRGARKATGPDPRQLTIDECIGQAADEEATT